MVTNDINKAYFSDYPFSYGGKYRLYSSFPKNDVDKALLHNDIYTQFFQHKRPKSYTPVYVWSKRELFECDTAYFADKNMVKENNGFKYLLCIIDVFSKYVYLYPLKSIQCEDVINCFEDLFSKCGKIPRKIYTDKGSEFKVIYSFYNIYSALLQLWYLVQSYEDIFILQKCQTHFFLFFTKMPKH